MHNVPLMIPANEGRVIISPAHLCRQKTEECVFDCLSSAFLTAFFNCFFAELFPRHLLADQWVSYL
jgi:hypothetical protein